MNDEDLKKIRNLVQEELDPIKKTLSYHTNILNEHTSKIDALTGDMIEVQDKVDAIWEKVSAESDQTKKDIKDIKAHIGLTTN